MKTERMSMIDLILTNESIFCVIVYLMNEMFSTAMQFEMMMCRIEFDAERSRVNLGRRVVSNDEFLVMLK
jgi:hypothetical protein